MELVDTDVMSQPKQFSLLGMFLVMTGVGGAFALFHGITYTNPLGAVVGLMLCASCIGVIAARGSIRG